MAFIAQNLHRPLRTAEIARAAALSEYHFHRVFLALTGERVGQFVTRCRLESAARSLAYEKDVSITEVALRCGYSSSANFSKAFSNYFGVSPSGVRDPSAWTPKASSVLQERHGKAFAPEEFFSPAERAPTEELLRAVQARLRFEQRDLTPLLCSSGPRGYDVSQAVALWQQFTTTLVNLGLWHDQLQMLGILYDDPIVTSESLCRYDACVDTSPVEGELPPPLFTSQLPAGRYAVFSYAGPIAELDLLYRDVYAVWFPRSGLAPDALPPIERYLSRGPDHDGNVELELLFKTRPARG